MNKFSLITTALEDFWDDEYEKIALGEWCDVYNTAKFDKVLPFIWDSASKKVEAIEITWKTYNSVIKELTILLNQHHKVNKSERYWELIIGNWLFSFIQVVYDRLLTLESFINLYPNFSTILLDKKSYSIPLEYVDFSLKVTQTDLYNLQIYSQILFYKGYNFKTKEYRNEQKYQYLKKSRQAKTIFLKILNFFTYKPNKTITSPYLDGGIKSYIKLIIASKGKLIFDDFDDSFSVNLNINKNDRKKIFQKEKSNDGFTTLLYHLFEDNFPILFLEGYSSFLDILNSKKRKKTSLYATSNALHGNYLYKFFLAENYKNINLVSIQHGGNYGNDAKCIVENYEKQVSNYFFCYGWGNGKEEINCSHEKINLPIKSNKNGNILLLSTAEPRYSFRIDLVYTSSLIKIIYIPKIISFLKNIKKLDDVLYRPYSKDFGFNIVENISQALPNLKIEYDRLKFKKRLSKSKLLVSDHFGTSVLETLAQNYPTIIFLEKQYFAFRKPELIELLEDAKILFYNEVEAAIHINVIENDIDSWWQSSKVQKAREEFCFYFARTSENWADEWIKEFNRILEENARA